MKKEYNRVEDFLWDDGFVKAVLCHSLLSSSYLEKLKVENAHSFKIMNEASRVLLAKNTDVQALQEDECLCLKQRIFNTLGL